MTKQPKQKAVYQSDAKFLRRLAQAVEWDEHKPQEWKLRVSSLLRSVAELFEESDATEKT